MRVLRPKGVSTGSTERQLLTSPQSPQPSQMRWLIATRCFGVGILPRLRARRASAAHAWSWISTVTPGTSASTFCASSSRLRCHTSTPSGSDPCGWRSGSSLVTSSRATPWVSSTRATAGTGSWPWGSCPPVIATVPL